MGTSRRFSFLNEDRAQTLHSQMLTGRRIAFTINSHFKISGVQGAVLEGCGLLRIDLKGDNLRALGRDPVGHGSERKEMVLIFEAWFRSRPNRNDLWTGVLI